VDRTGEAIETAWDVLNIGWGVKSFVDNVRSGDYGSAAVDAVGVVVDSAAAAVPLIPGGAGAVIKGARLAGKADDIVDGVKALNRADDAADATKATRNPFGSKGKPDHQAKVEELANKAKGEARPGEQVVRERKIQGHDSTRKPDVQIVGPDGKTRKVLEAERRPNSPRNRTREEEYRKLKVEQETHGLK
jgi:hypothetical protein